MTLREDAVEYVAAILDEVIADAGILPLDTAGNFLEPLNTVDRSMVYTGLPLDDEMAQQAAYMALAEYHVLLRVRYKITMRFDVGISGDSYRLSQAVAQVDKLIADAKERALALAGPAAVLGGGSGGPAGVTGADIGEIEIDWSGCESRGEYEGW